MIPTSGSLSSNVTEVVGFQVCNLAADISKVEVAEVPILLCWWVFINRRRGLLESPEDTIQHHFMPCYALLCYAMVCHALPCHVCAVLCSAMLCYAMLCYAMSCYAVLCCAVLCYAMLCCAVLCCATLCYAMLRPISLPRRSLLRLLDSNCPGNSMWALESHPLKLRFCLSQTRWNPES